MKNENIDNKLGIKGKLIEKFNIGEEIADELIEDYGFNVINIIKEKPYVLCHYKINFDNVKRIIVENDSDNNQNYKNRNVVAAAILYASEYLSRFEGHTFIYKYELETKIEHLGEAVSKKDLEETLEFLETDSEIVREFDYEGRECIYLSRLYKAEVELANLITYFVEENKKCNYNLNKVNEFIDGYDSADIKLNHLQQEAVKMSLTNKISILTGVAGGGKTTAIKAIVEGFKHLNENNIQLVSFMGKAVERMNSITGMQGSTIHRLLGIGVEDKKKVSSIEADVLIIDEAGTIGLELFKMLFESLKDDKSIKIVIVGDKFQLPSIAPGSVLSQLLKGELIPVVNLTEVIRQKEESLIINNAHKVINKGIGINGKKSGVWLKKNEFEFVEADSEEIDDKVINKIDRLMSDGISIYDIQVMSPIRGGNNGVNELNMKIAHRFNNILDRESYRFGILDPIIATKNNCKKHVFNGQHGIITSIETNMNKIEAVTVNFSGKEKTFKKKEIQENIELAYVLSVHKMQGSESNVVIIVIDKNHEIMLNRELIYVALTRGIEQVIIIGNKEVFNEGVKRVNKERHSLLAERIIGISIAS